MHGRLIFEPGHMCSCEWKRREQQQWTRKSFQNARGKSVFTHTHTSKNRVICRGKKKKTYTVWLFKRQLSGDENTHMKWHKYYVCGRSVAPALGHSRRHSSQVSIKLKDDKNQVNHQSLTEYFRFRMQSIYRSKYTLGTLGIRSMWETECARAAIATVVSQSKGKSVSLHFAMNFR